MNKTLSLPFLSFYGIGMILGAGIYSVIGKAAGVAQESLWVSFLLAAFSALCTALSYAELSALFPKAGAEYVYLKKIFPKAPIVASVCGTMMIFSGLATAASVALAFSGYLQQFLEAPSLVVAFLVLALFSLVNILGIRESSWVNAIFTLIEVAGLVLFIWLGYKHADLSRPLESLSLSSGAFAGAALIFFAYLGFENMVNLAEETKDAHENVPKAILISLGIATCLYFLVSLAALALMPPEELAKSDAVLSDAARKYAPGVAKSLGGIALFSTANTVLIALLSTSRIVLGMARGKNLPAFLATVSVKKQTPWKASLLVLFLTLCFLPLKKIEVIASASSLATLLTFMTVNAALIYLRYTNPEAERPFRVPGHLGPLPVIPLFGIITSVFLLFQFEAQVYGVGFLFVLLALLIYFFNNKRAVS